MNKLIILAVLAAMAYAKPLEQAVSLTQDTLGNYNLRYVTEDVNRDEQGFEGGKVIGSYSYTDKDGQHHKITYVAAPNAGFTATGDIPQQVQETAEVAEARRVHLALVQKELALVPEIREEPTVVDLSQIQEAIRSLSYDQPIHHEEPADVVAARAEHILEHKAQLDALAEAYRRLAHL